VNQKACRSIFAFLISFSSFSKSKDQGIRCSYFVIAFNQFYNLPNSLIVFIHKHVFFTLSELDWGGIKKDASSLAASSEEVVSLIQLSTSFRIINIGCTVSNLSLGTLTVPESLDNAGIFFLSQLSSCAEDCLCILKHDWD
jgi:hypothetical protein